MPFPPRGEVEIFGALRVTTSDEPRDDRAIVDAVLAGDQEAYRVLVERESAAVVRACHRVLGDLHEAEDAAQEAFVTAYRSLASWRGDGPFGAWLTRIAVRIALREAGSRRSITWLDTSPSAPDEAASDPGQRAAASAAIDGCREHGPLALDCPRRTRDRCPPRRHSPPGALSGKSSRSASSAR